MIVSTHYTLHMCCIVYLTSKALLLYVRFALSSVKCKWWKLTSNGKAYRMFSFMIVKECLLISTLEFMNTNVVRNHDSGERIVSIRGSRWES